MYIESLSLKNIGPFTEAELQFPTEKGADGHIPVTIITGENGSGKTIILDAIRVGFYGHYEFIERDIRNKNADIKLKPIIGTNKNVGLTVQSLREYVGENTYNGLFDPEKEIKRGIDWIVMYWTSKIASGSYEVKNLVTPKPENFLQDALTGVHENTEVTELICFFDYLKDSNAPDEKELGMFLYSTLEKMMEKCLNNGCLKYVKRSTLEPIHPKWQQTLLDTILTFFPNLQIILTTHSPFIVAAAQAPKVYVCEPKSGYSEITDYTREYSNMPIDEILRTPVFSETATFSAKISNLLAKRKKAIQEGDKELEDEIEAELLTLNPEYFNYLEIEKELKKLED